MTDASPAVTGEGASVPACTCHGEPMYWNRDVRYRAGGFWRCRVRSLVRMRARYDADPLHRITKQLGHRARIGRQRIERMKEGLSG